MSRMAAPPISPRITRVNSSLRASREGVETARIAGSARIAVIVGMSVAAVISADPRARAPKANPASSIAEETVRWPALAGATVSDYEEACQLLDRRKWAEAAIIFKSVLRA